MDLGHGNGKVLRSANFGRSNFASFPKRLKGWKKKKTGFQSDIKRVALEKLPFRSSTGRVFFPEIKNLVCELSIIKSFQLVNISENYSWFHSDANLSTASEVRETMMFSICTYLYQDLYLVWKWGTLPQQIAMENNEDWIWQSGSRGKQ